MTREDILASIGTMKSELYVLNEEKQQIMDECDDLIMQARFNKSSILSAHNALLYHERELRLHDLVTFCNTGRYPE